MKILITGGAGFIGGNLTRRLVREGHEVTVVSTGSESNLQGVKKTIYMGLDGIAWDQVWDKEVVFHQMANNDTLCDDKEEMFRANVYGPMTLFHQCLAGGCKKFIYASSTAVYGNSAAPYVEDFTPVSPTSVYGESKAKFDEFAMNFAKEHNVQVIGLRYCNVYGPGEERKGRRMSMIGQLLNKMIQNKEPELFRYGEQKRDWIYVDDVVEANILAMENNNFKGEIYNLGTGRSYTFNHLITTINDILEKELPPKYIDCNIDYKKYQNHTECDINKIKRELGFDPKFSLKSGIREYYANIINSKT